MSERRADEAPDFLGLYSQLSAEEALTARTVRQLVQEQAVPRAAEHFEAGTFPLELVPAMAEMGLFGMHLQGYGCAGLSAVAYGLACRELERGDSGLRSFVSVQGSLVMYPILTFGSDAQKQRWLPAMAAGKAIGCFGLTEPDFGSNPAGMLTTARKDGDSYVLNGSKRWITNGTIADVALVWAKLDGVVRGFLVERGTPGFAASEIDRKMSLRASITAELVFDECRVPAQNLLEGVAGLRGPLSCLNEARYGILWGAVGAAEACYTAALDYALSRVQFGRPIAGYQLTQAKLVNMLAEITKAQLLALQLGRLKEAGSISPAQISLGKMNNVREALKIAREARSILGANGISLDYPVVRHMLNLESLLTYEGTNEIHLLTLGRDITGLAAFD
ncbi:MAG TPA: acyl-CoA dehydrogenase family protein [Chloroflexota bacterium]|nr:acyl-CoA dehydrogenase family protein [Chloroflexota bacterium]